jgi:dethiobiotin synthetase
LFFEETYLLKEAMSPHAAAGKEGIRIDVDKIVAPDNDDNDLIIEGAGGVLVPLNDKDFVIDLIKKLDAEIILVSNIYLGSINHTLLTINEIKRRNIPVKGIIFNGPENKDTEDFILNYSGYRCLLRIRPEEKITEEVITKYSVKLFENWD